MIKYLDFEGQPRTYRESVEIMKRYPEYKNSELGWVGEIPTHWKVLKFHRLSQESRRKNYDDVDREMLSLSSYTGIQVKRYEYESTKRSKDESLTYLVVEPNQLVVNPMWQIQRGIGVSFIHGIVSPGYRVYYIDLKRLVPPYLHHLMRSDIYVDEYNKHIRGLTTYDRSVKKEDFEEIGVLIPPKHEQTQIAAFLDRKTEQIDELIGVKERKIELLREQRTALINQAVTKGLDPNVKMKPSGVAWIGEIPRHWIMKRLKHVTDSIKNGTTVPQVLSGQTDYPVTRIETISKGEINFDKVGHVNYRDGIETYRLRLGDILLSHINSLAILGNCAMLANAACLYHGMNLLRIRPNNLIDNRFLLYWLKSHVTNQQMKSFAKLAIGQVSISITNLKEIPLSYPVLNEQIQIADYLDRKTAQIDELVSEQQRSIKLLKEYRQSLISDAVTGKIDVRSEV